jgi:putative ABC transport system permease protein
MKGTMVEWFDRSIRADVFVFAGREVKAKFEHPLPDSIGEGIRGIDGVVLVNGFRMVRQEFRGQPFYLISHDLPNYLRFNTVPVVEGSIADALPAIVDGSGIAASESFSHIFDVHVGDVISLPTPDGPRSFRVTLVYVDYTADLGLLTTTQEQYRKIWRDPLVDSFGVYLAKDADAKKVRDEIASRWGGQYGLLVLQNADYQRELLLLIDRSFALTRAMELVAIIVAVLGIVNTLLVAVIDRRMEIGILKAIGAVGPQVRRMFMIEAGLIGFAATVMGVAIGSVFSFYIVRELLSLQIGWQLTYRFPTVEVLETFVLAQVVAWAGAWWPARSASKLDVVDALEYE